MEKIAKALDQALESVENYACDKVEAAEHLLEKKLEEQRKVLGETGKKVQDWAGREWSNVQEMFAPKAQEVGNTPPDTDLAPAGEAGAIRPSPGFFSTDGSYNPPAVLTPTAADSDTGQAGHPDGNFGPSEVPDHPWRTLGNHPSSDDPHGFIRDSPPPAASTGEFQIPTSDPDFQRLRQDLRHIQDRSDDNREHSLDRQIVAPRPLDSNVDQNRVPSSSPAATPEVVLPDPPATPELSEPLESPPVPQGWIPPTSPSNNLLADSFPSASGRSVVATEDDTLIPSSPSPAAIGVSRDATDQPDGSSDLSSTASPRSFSSPHETLSDEGGGAVRAGTADFHDLAQMAQRSMEEAQGHAQTAHGHTEEAQEYAQTAHGHADEAHGHAQTAHGHTEEAQGHAQTAHGHTEEAQEHAQTAHGHTEEAQGHAQTAHGHTEEAHGYAQTAQGHMEEAHSHREQAQSALQEVHGLLSQINHYKELIAQLHDEVQRLRDQAGQAHQETMHHRDQAATHLSEAQGHARKAEDHMLDAQGHATKAEGHANDAEGHSHKAESHVLDVEHSVTIAERVAIKAEGHANDAEGRARTAEDHMLGAQSHATKAESHAHDTQNHLHKTEGHSNEAEGHATSARNHALDAHQYANEAMHASHRAQH